MDSRHYDICILGGGPGGYVTAIRASQLGMNVVLVEERHLGGICLNWGCIPTKALLRSAEIYQHMKHAENFGLSASEINFDLQEIVKRSRNISTQLTQGVAYLLKKNKVEVLRGHGRLNGSSKIVVDDGKVQTDLSATHIILATGARARTLPEIEPDNNFIWTYKEALVAESIPKSLLVIGSGAIGLEFASFFNTFGASVTVVELLPQILPNEDAEIVVHAQQRFEKQGLKIITSAKVVNIDKHKNNVTATIEAIDGTTTYVDFDRVISAVGVVGNTEDIGLETTRVKIDRGCIVTDEFSCTSEPHIFAIGDVAGPPMLAHKAEHEGVICVENIAGIPGVHPLKTQQIPGCTYTNPQVASVGLTEKGAQAAGYDLKVGRFPFTANGKAIALGEPDGLIKTIFDAKTGQLLGAHMVGAEVTELIQGFVIAMGLETTEEELIQTVFPHPTLSEMMHESVMDAYGRVIHY